MFSIAKKKRPSPCTKAVDHLIDVNINFLAIDFDQTLIDIHTGGVWKGSVEELAPHVRPDFRDLLIEALDRNVCVAIVTFSQQPRLIQNVLETAIGSERAARIPVRGEDKSWTYEGEGSREGKQAHMASAVEELEASGLVKITRSTTLLIDDDKRNVKTALENGVRALLFQPKKPHTLLDNLQNVP